MRAQCPGHNGCYEKLWLSVWPRFEQKFWGVHFDSNVSFSNTVCISRNAVKEKCTHCERRDSANDISEEKTEAYATSSKLPGNVLGRR